MKSVCFYNISPQLPTDSEIKLSSRFLATVKTTNKHSRRTLLACNNAISSEDLFLKLPSNLEPRHKSLLNRPQNSSCGIKNWITATQGQSGENSDVLSHKLKTNDKGKIGKRPLGQITINLDGNCRWSYFLCLAPEMDVGYRNPWESCTKSNWRFRF